MDKFYELVTKIRLSGEVPESSNVVTHLEQLLIASHHLKFSSPFVLTMLNVYNGGLFWYNIRLESKDWGFESAEQTPCNDSGQVVQAH